MTYKSLIVTFIILINSTYANSKFVKMTISPWISKCQIENNAKKCLSPISFTAPIEMNIEIKEANGPGSAAVSTSNFESDNPLLFGKVKSFSIFPYSNSPHPPHVQFQTIIESPIYLMCAHSISLENLGSIPPLLCSSDYNGDRLGATITFGKLEL